MGRSRRKRSSEPECSDSETEPGTGTECVCAQSPTGRAKRVRFADAPSEISGKYGTSDGHSLDEGRGVVPVRCSDRKWVARITPSEVRQLESELGEEYQASLDRLKRRAGMLSRVQLVSLGLLNQSTSRMAIKADAGEVDAPKPTLPGSSIRLGSLTGSLRGSAPLKNGL
ncbi:hypothetical protein F751_6514 [Auxenochlorella protothecoides]|nr:hypothetical protein F751_6514 [Auxenochlorella protothecoides]KFM28995.1 hypothetical protein F751_6514 [Auxenochlorella protothecoides]RMZ54791.1 hypothetical protein APUTEX25_000308 [Auxenochlorella protothecoides]|eukprot:RMZ54791.1 hypothetical protein APUTEX25_000308 [Auxenochlorella protothecoides]